MALVENPDTIVGKEIPDWQFIGAGVHVLLFGSQPVLVSLQLPDLFVAFVHGESL